MRLCARFLWLIGSNPVFGNVIFMIVVLSLWCSLSERFVSLAYACVDSFVLLPFLPFLIAIFFDVGLYALLRKLSLKSFEVCTALQCPYALPSSCVFFFFFLKKKVSLNSLSSASMSWILLSFRALSSFGFLLPNAVLVLADISLTYLTKFLVICYRAWTLQKSLSISLLPPPPRPRVSSKWYELGETGRWPWQLPITSNVPIIINLTFSQYVPFSVCPPDNINVVEWDKKRASLWDTQCLSFLNMMTRNEASRYTPEIMFWLPIRLVLVVALQNLFIRLSLKITAVFFFSSNSVGCSDLRTFSCQLCGTVDTWENEIVSFFRHKNFFCLSLFLNTHRMRRCPAIHQRQLQVRLLSIFLPHAERIPWKMSETTFLPNWWSLAWCFVNIGWSSTFTPNEMISPQ